MTTYVWKDGQPIDIGNYTNDQDVRRKYRDLYLCDSRVEATKGGRWGMWVDDDFIGYLIWEELGIQPIPKEFLTTLLLMGVAT